MTIRQSDDNSDAPSKDWGFDRYILIPLTCHARINKSEICCQLRYNDPSHPGCRREIDASGNVYGSDPIPIKPGAPCVPGQPSSPWTLKAIIAPDDRSIAIDFDPIDEVKQGPVTGTWTGTGLKLPNGLWTKKE